MALALVSRVVLSAFEPGKSNAVICHSKNGKAAAQLLAKCLNKVDGRKYTLTAANAAGSAAGIYVGLPAPGVKNPAADDREYCVLHVNDSKLFLYGNAKYKCDMFAVSALRLNSPAAWSAGRRANCPDWIAAISPGCGCVSWLR